MCKFFQGSEDKELERQLKLVFKIVHREKPESSRSVSTLIWVTGRDTSFMLLSLAGIERSVLCWAQKEGSNIRETA